jgi:hypothetical protein
MSNSYGSCPDFGEIDLNFGSASELEEDRPTWPSPGSATLVVEDKCLALLFSATWTLIATVNGVEISRSSESDHARSDAYIKRWTRMLIRSKYDELRHMGVDADAEYLKQGGLLEDLLDP